VRPHVCDGMLKCLLVSHSTSLHLTTLGVGQMEKKKFGHWLSVAVSIDLTFLL